MPPEKGSLDQATLEFSAAKIDRHCKACRDTPDSSSASLHRLQVTITLQSLHGRYEKADIDSSKHLESSLLTCKTCWNSNPGRDGVLTGMRTCGIVTGNWEK